MFLSSRINRIVMWIILATLFASCVMIAPFTLGHVKSYVISALLAAAIPFWLVGLWKRGSKKCWNVGANLFEIGLAGFCIVSILSYFVARAFDNPDSTGNLLVLLLSTVACFHIGCLDEISRVRFLRCLVSALFITGVLQSGMGVAQFLFDEDMMGMYKTLVSGTLVSPNLFAGWLAISLCASVVLFLRATDRLRKWLYVLCIALMASAILLSRSRGALLSIVLAVLTLFGCYLYKVKLKTRRRARRMVLLSFIAALGALVAAFCLLDFNSSMGRVLKLSVGGSIIYANPVFGVGYGQYENTWLSFQSDFLNRSDNRVFELRANEDTTTNNQYLKVAIELGIIGLTLFCLMMFVVARGIFALDLRHSPRDNPYGYFVAVAMLCMLFHMFFDETLRFPVMILLFLLLCAFVPAKRSIKLPVGPAGKIAMTFMSVGLLAGCIFHIEKYGSERDMAKARSFLSVGDFSNAAFFGMRSVKAFPIYAKAKVVLGRALIGLGNEIPADLDSSTVKGVRILESLADRNPSRDLFLALAVGYYRAGEHEGARHYAWRAHEAFPMQIRPRLMLHLIEPQKYSDMQGLRNNILSLSFTQPDRQRMLELLDETICAEISESPRTRELLNLIMLAH